MLRVVFPSILLGILFIGAAILGGDEKKKGPKVKYQYNEDENSLLWEISGKDLKEPSYLYGTIHIMRKEVFAYDTIVKSIFDSCHAYAMELNMADIDMKTMAKTMMMDKPLDSVISAEKYQRLDSLMKIHAGMSLSLMKNTKPFFILANMMKDEIGGDMKTPLDLDFYMKAQQAGKKLIGIEKFEEQMAAVNSMSIEQQVDMLIESFTDTSSSVSKFEEMMKMYLEQNLQAITKMTIEDDAFPASFNEEFIVKRNRVMAVRIAAISAKRMTFNAIGAAHLPGKNGVIELLRSAGYVVKPIKFTFSKN